VHLEARAFRPAPARDAAPAQAGLRDADRTLALRRAARLPRGRARRDAPRAGWPLSAGRRASPRRRARARRRRPPQAALDPSGLPPVVVDLEGLATGARGRARA